MNVEWNGIWSTDQEKWIRGLIQGICIYLSHQRPLFVGDLDASALGKPKYMCYVSKPEHTEDPNQTYHAYFQPYHLRDREPICGIQVEYRLNAMEQAIVYVQPMGMAPYSL